MSLLVTASEGLTGEIGVYADGELVGSGILEGGRCGIAVWGDDFSTPEVDGATDGAALTLRMVNGAVDKVEVQQGELRYSTDAFTVARLGAATAPLEFGLTSAYPNPFNGAVRLGYALTEAGRLDLSIFDLNGRLVATLASGERPAGAYATVWDASSMPSGLYVARLESGSLTAQTKLMLVK